MKQFSSSPTIIHELWLSTYILLLFSLDAYISHECEMIPFGIGDRASGTDDGLHRVSNRAKSRELHSS